MHNLFTILLFSFFAACASEQDGYFQSFKNKVFDGYEFVKQKLGLQTTHEEKFKQIEKKVESDFEQLEKKSIIDLEKEKKNIRLSRSKVDEIVDKITIDADNYYEANKEKLNQNWTKLNKKIIAFNQKLAQIQTVYDKACINKNMLQSLDSQLAKHKQLGLIKKSRKEVADALAKLTELQEINRRLYDEFEEEFSDLSDEINEYQQKIDDRFKQCERAMKTALDTSKEAISRELKKSKN